MTLAEVYEALGKQDGGEALASTIKAEIVKSMQRQPSSAQLKMRLMQRSPNSKRRCRS